MGQIRTSHALEIHCEERNVSEFVPETQSGVELEAIDQAWPVRKAKDRVRSQVSVSVDDVAFGDPALEHLASPLKIAPHEGTVSVSDSFAQHTLHQRIQFVQIRLPSGRQTLSSRYGVNLSAATCLEVKRCENVSHTN